MAHYDPPLTLGLDAAAIAALWGLAATPIAYAAVRAILTRHAAPATESVRRPTMARCAITTGLALILAALAGWLLLSAALTGPPAQADTAGNASDTGLRRDATATKHAVSEAFPQIDHHERTSPMYELRPGAGAPVVHHCTGGAQ